MKQPPKNEHETVTVSFTQEKLARLKRHYNNAVADNKRQFMFEGNAILTDYAKYMIEYLEGKV